jgi:enoyl-CoA hydratase/carnithine racemase
MNPEDVVQFQRVGAHIAVLTLNRPQARNAVNAALAQALERHVKAVEADAQIRVAILTGAGNQAFCAGADLKELAGGSAPGARSTPDGGFAGFVHAPKRKLWIAAVNGAAVAGGFELMLACDLAVASQHAVFGLPEVQRGLIAAAGGIYRLPRSLPRAIALEMIATGDPIDAQRALAWGLVNRVVAPEEVLDSALQLAGRVCANAPFAVAESLAVARRVPDLDEAALRALARAGIDRLVQTDDYLEGPRAFAEHRPPVWTGH